MQICEHIESQQLFVRVVAYRRVGVRILLESRKQLLRESFQWNCIKCCLAINEAFALFAPIDTLTYVLWPEH